MAEGGLAIGAIIKNMLGTDRLFCESFVSNLMVEFPSATSLGEVTDPRASHTNNLAVVIGNLAISAKDDTVLYKLLVFLTDACRFPKFACRVY